MDAQAITEAHAQALHQAVGLPTLTATIREAEGGGGWTYIGFANLDAFEAEHIAMTILKELLAGIVAENHPCPSCEARMERLTAAIAALEGHKASNAPTTEARH